MTRHLAPWLAGAATAAVLDLLWLGVAAKNVYSSRLGHLMADKVYWPAAILFYLLYGAGALYFAAIPALRIGSARLAVVNGGLLGLLAYGTYDLTNMAVLRGWGGFISAVDVAWGVFLTACVAGVAYRFGR